MTRLAVCVAVAVLAVACSSPRDRPAVGADPAPTASAVAAAPEDPPAGDAAPDGEGEPTGVEARGAVSPTPTAPALEAPAPPEASPESPHRDLEGVLLAPEDVGPGWHQRELPVHEPEGSLRVCGTVPLVLSAEDVGIFTGMQHEDDGSFLINSLLEVDPRRARGQIDDLQAAAGMCTEWDEPDGTRWRIDAAQAARAGEASIAFMLRSVGTTVPHRLHVVVWHREDVFVGLAWIAVGVDYDADTVERAMRAVDARLARAIAGDAQ